MSEAISIFHGKFGRATLYHLDRSIIPHAHREGHLLFHVSGSAGSIAVDGCKHFISSDVAVAVNPWQLHAYAPEASRGQYILVLYIRPSWFSEFPHYDSEGLRFGRASFEMTSEVHQMVQRITEFLSGRSDSEMFDDHLHRLARACFDLTQDGPQSPLPLSARIHRNDFRIRKSLSFMADRFDVDLDVARIAADAGLSRSHFFKLFQSQLGVTPRMFWNTLRLERSFQELVETDKPIADISFDLGFSSQSGFSRFFALNTGLAPTDYRRVGHVIRA